MAYVLHRQPYEVASARLTVKCKVKERQLSRPVSELQAHALAGGWNEWIASQSSAKLGMSGILPIDRKKTIFGLSIIWGLIVRYSTRIKPISYLKANAAEVLEDLRRQRQPMIITQNGEAKAVIQDVASFEETQETLALLKILALGGEQVAQGKVKSVRDVVNRLRSTTPDD